MTSPRTAAGSLWISTGLACAAPGLKPGGSRTPRSSATISVASRLENTAPKIATPNEPPMDRKKVAPEVAVPRSA